MSAQYKAFVYTIGISIFIVVSRYAYPLIDITDALALPRDPIYTYMDNDEDMPLTMLYNVNCSQFVTFVGGNV